MRHYNFKLLLWAEAPSAPIPLFWGGPHSPLLAVGHPGAAHLFAGMWKLIAVVHSCGIWPKFLSSQCLSWKTPNPAPASASTPIFPHLPLPAGFPLSVVVWALKSWKQCAFSSRVCVALDRVLSSFGAFVCAACWLVFFFSLVVLLRKFYIFLSVWGWSIFTFGSWLR